ncbi:MAG: hypothetical protein AAF911_15340 [Planctomycetota bacterium]
MKTWRTPRESAQRRYRDTQYPSDLAADLGLERSIAGRIGPWRRGAAVAAALLLAVSAWWIASRPAPGPLETPGPIAIESTPPEQTEPAPVTVPTVDATMTATAVAVAEPLDPNTVGVRLSEAPRIRGLNRPGPVDRVTPPSRPRNLSLGTTPRRFPGVNTQIADTPPPSSRRPQDEHPDHELT